MSSDSGTLEEIRDLLLKIEQNTRGMHAKLPPGDTGATSHISFTGWKAEKVPSWAKYDAGVPLGLLSAKGLEFWFNWQPRNWTHKTTGKEMPPSSGDVALRKALDAAQAAIKAGTYTPPAFGPKRPKSDAPPPANDFADNADKPEPPPKDNLDEDVPF